MVTVKKLAVVTLCSLVLAAGALDSRLKAMVPTERIQKGKKLVCPAVDTLNRYFATDPYPVFRMDLACQNALKVAHEMETRAGVDKAFIAAKIKSILDPVKDFLGYIHTFSGIVKPLIEESLTSQPGADKANCLILKFCESKDDAYAFFNKNVNDKAVLVSACKEFTTLFEDIKASLNDDAMKAYNELMLKLKNFQKNK